MILYTNYKGITKNRKILPQKIFFGKNEWHKEEQWLMLAYDYDKCADRSFALKDIKNWCVGE